MARDSVFLFFVLELQSHESWIIRYAEGGRPAKIDQVGGFGEGCGGSKIVKGRVDKGKRKK